MLNLKQTSILTLLLATGLPATAQAPRIGGLAQAWYTQMMDNSLRTMNRTPSSRTYGYYPHPAFFGPFQENGLSLKRIEVSASGTAGDQVEYRVMYDVSSIPNPNPILQDAFIKYKLPNKIEAQVGQFKLMGLDAAIIAPMNMLFVEHSQIGLLFGSRDRGASVSAGFGDDGFNGRVWVAMFNGSGRLNDANSQKDLLLRADFRIGKQHYLGAYALQGSTSAADAGNLTTPGFGPSDAPFGGLFPTRDEILDNKDKTSVTGAFYEFDNSALYASAEVVTGTWGRFFPSVGVSPVRREHLDQSFLGCNVVGGYTFGEKKNHKVVARYDMMNYNSGDDWYGSTNPYKSPKGDDISPNYTEITVGYVYAFMPESYRAANIKVNYTLRNKNFLIAPDGSATGGDSLSLAFQVAF